MRVRQCLLRAGPLIAAATLAACATKPRPLYQWAGYQGAVYEFLKSGGSNLARRIDELEEQLKKNSAANEASPPGLHGHLALLYSKAGDDASATKHLEAERRLFPESAAYVDFLLRNSSRKPSP